MPLNPAFAEITGSSLRLTSAPPSCSIAKTPIVPFPGIQRVQELAVSVTAISRLPDPVGLIPKTVAPIGVNDPSVPM